MSIALFDLEFRPASYWGPQDLGDYFRSRLTGELRGRAISKEADDYRGSDNFLKSSLDPSLRSAIAGMHPSLMSGEYLPPLKSNEVEIARVVLASTLGDVTSIRARNTKQRIVYRIVDEYMEQGADRFKLPQKTSQKPLSLGQIILIIDENNLVAGPRDLNIEGGMDYEEACNFATVSSVFYPQLAQWFEKESEDWRAEQEAEHLGDKDEIETAAEQARATTDELERVIEPWREHFDGFMSEWLKTDRPSSGNTQIGHRMRRGALERYLMAYCMRKGAFPSGQHKIKWQNGRNVMTIDFSL